MVRAKEVRPLKFFVKLALPIEITVNGGGINPAAGTVSYNNPALSGVEFYIQQAGFGPLSYSAYEYIDDDGKNAADETHGVFTGFRLLNNLKFADAESYFVLITGVVYDEAPIADYTNGYHYNKVINALFGRHGWKQPTQAEFQIIEPANLVSRSGRYFNDGSFHPLVTVPNIKATIEDYSISNPDFNKQLQQIQKSSILQALTAVFNKPELIEQTLLFERSWNNDELIVNGGNFVGIRFKLAPTNVAMQITSLALYFNAAKTFTLFLYHDTKKQPLWQQDVTTVADDAQMITPSTGLYLNALINTFKSGFFYLGYYQDDLNGGQAYDERKRSYAPGKCFGWDFFQAKKTGDDFDRKNVSLTSYNFGMNAEVTVFRDHTLSIIRNAPLFDDAVGLQVAYHLIKQAIYAVRSGVNERILKEALAQYGIVYELEGSVPVSDVPKSTGLKQRIEQALKSLNKSFFPDPEPIVTSLC